MDRNYMKFIIAYDFGDVLDNMLLACDEAYELAEYIIDMFEDKTTEEERYYEYLYEFVSELDLPYVWNSIVKVGKWICQYDLSEVIKYAWKSG